MKSDWYVSPIGRRVRFAVVILVSQMLLVALAVTWLIHTLIIAIDGAVYFSEVNPIILWGEIVLTVLITAFAIAVLVVQIQRLGERRKADR